MNISIWSFGFNNDRPVVSGTVDGQVYSIGVNEKEALAVAKKEYPFIYFGKGYDCGATIKRSHSHD